LKVINKDGKPKIQVQNKPNSRTSCVAPHFVHLIRSNMLLLDPQGGAKFEELNIDLFRQTMKTVEQVLKGASIKHEDVSDMSPASYFPSCVP
jgi:hypothetical protein